MLNIILAIISIYQITLPNGLRVALEENHASPVTAVYIFVDVGGAYEGEYTGRGLSHFCEHVVAGGTTQYHSEDEYNQMTQMYGIYSNAYTAHERTCYHKTGPSEYTEQMISMDMEQVFSCVFDSFEVNREHGVISHEILTSETPESKSWREMLNFIAGNHPLSVPILGYKDAMAGITRDIVYTFYCQHYTPANAVMVVVGDFNTEQILEYIKKEAEKFPAQPYSPATMDPLPSYLYSRADSFIGDIAEPEINLIWIAAQGNTEDDCALNLLSDYLSLGHSSILERVLVREKELAVSVWCWNWGLRRSPGIFTMGATADDPAKLNQAKQELLAQLELVLQGKIDEQRLQRVKRLIRYEMIKDRTVDHQAEYIGSGLLYTNDPYYYPDRYLEQINKVTPQEMIEVARKYLDPEKVQVFYNIPEIMIEDQLSLTEVNPGLIPFEKYQMPGYPAIICQKIPESQYVNITLAIGGGDKLDASRLEGLSRMFLEHIMRKTTLMSEDQISELKDDYGIETRISSTPDILYFNIGVPLENFHQALKLLGNSLQQIEFSEYTVEDIRRELTEEVSSRDKNPNYIHIKFIYSKFFPENTYGDFMSNQTLDNIQPEDLNDLYRIVMNNSNIVIAVSGDIDPDEIQLILENEFPKFPDGENLSRSSSLFSDYLNYTPVTDSQIYDYPQTYVSVMFPTGKEYGDEGIASLYIIDQLLSGSAFRLHQALRGREDLVYWGWGYQMAYGATGVFIFNSQTSLKNEDRIKQIYQEEIDKLVTELMTEEELANAKTSILSGFSMHLQQPSARVRQAAKMYLYNLPLDYLEGQLSEQINALTAQDIQNAAVELFDQGSWLISRPETSDF
ncbi:MAG: M16 family metallopeptidase [bacterium]